METIIRHAEEADLPALVSIYNHYIRETPVTFDIEEQTVEQRKAAWFSNFTVDGRHRCLVAEEGGKRLGWACSGPFRGKRAYETSVEFSVYLDPAAGGRGLGRRLYETLIAELEGADVHRALGGITLPNEASVALHRAVGFTEIGIFREVGRKFGRYWDVLWMERALGEPVSR